MAVKKKLSAKPVRKPTRKPVRKPAKIQKGARRERESQAVKPSRERLRPSSPREVKKVRDEAIARAEAGAGMEWMDQMELVLIEVCKNKMYFTSDDVAALADIRKVDPPEDLRALGAVMTAGARNFLCEKEIGVAPVASVRRSLHGSPRAVWRSLYLLKPQAEEHRIKTILATVRTPIADLLED